MPMFQALLVRIYRTVAPGALKEEKKTKRFPVSWYLFFYFHSLVLSNHFLFQWLTHALKCVNRLFSSLCFGKCNQCVVPLSTWLTIAVHFTQCSQNQNWVQIHVYFLLVNSRRYKMNHFRRDSSDIQFNRWNNLFLQWMIRITKICRLAALKANTMD